MRSPEELQRMHQVLIFMLFLCPIGVIRIYFFLRTDKGKSFSLPVKVFALAMPLVAAGVLLLLW